MSSLKTTKATRRTIFKPSKRLEEMSKPTKLFEPIDNGAPYRIKKSALRYKCTPHIERLALPLERHYWKPTLKEPEPCVSSYFKVPKRALKAKSTPRITELAQPRNTRNNKSCLEIRSKPLEGKRVEHIIDLAGSKTPKNSRPAKKGRAKRCSNSVEERNQVNCPSKSENTRKTTKSSKTKQELQSKLAAIYGSNRD